MSGHTHVHAHHQDHGEAASPQGLKAAFFINTGILIAEVVGSLLTGSLALLADAAHNLSDVLALALSWWADRFSARPADERRSYGFGRAEILVALFNGASLLGVTAFIIYEAVARLLHPESVNGEGMFWVVLAALIGNSLSALLLKGEADDDLNRRSAFLHLLADALFSLGVLAAGAIVWRWGLTWIDPLFSLVIAIFFIRGSLSVVRESVAVLMEAVPAGLNPQEVQMAIAEVDGIASVHDLHIWNVSSRARALSAHIELAQPDCGSALAAKALARTLLAERFSIAHATLETEPEAYAREGACASCVFVGGNASAGSNHEDAHHH